MGILRTGKIQSHGPDVGITARITALEDKYVKALWYAEIGSGASGTITPPTNGTIVLNEWGNDVDAVTSTIVTGKKPDFVSAKTSAGALVTATLAANGDWTISGAPSAYPIAIVYVYEIKLINFDRAYSLYEEEFGQSVNPSDSPTFVGLTLSGLTAGGIVIADAGTIGLGSGKALIQFDDETVDFISLLNCNVGIGTPGPSQMLEVVGNILSRITVGGSDQALLGSVSSYPGIWFGTGATSPSVSNYAFLSDQGGGTILNAPSTSVFLRVANATYAVLNTNGLAINNGTTGAGTGVGLIVTTGKVGIGDVAPDELLDVAGNINATGVLKIDDVQVVSNRVIDARCDDAINSGDATTDGVIDALRDAMITHGLIAAA